MLDNLVLGRYYNVESTIHRLSPVFKIISLLVMVVSIFFIDSYVDLVMLGSYLLLAIMYSNIDVKVYLKSIFSIRIFLIFVLVIDLIFFTSVDRVVFDLFRLIFIVLYSSILTLTTSITEITYGIERILKPLEKFISVNDIAMVISLTLRYIPTLSEESSRIIRAQKLRGVDFKSKSIKMKIKIVGGVLIPMFTLSLDKSEKLADIMDVRLYGYGKSRTNYRSNEWRKLDSLLTILDILILIIVIVY